MAQAGQVQMQPMQFIRAATAADPNALPGAVGPVPGNFNRIGAGGLGATAALPAFVAAPAAGGVPLAFAAGGLNANDYQDALEKVHYLQGYMNNSRDVGRKLADFRDFALQRLRQIVVRLQSIGQIAGAGAAAQASLVQLIQDINTAGGPTRAQAQAMADLAAEMQNVDIPAEIAALVAEVNNLAQGLNATAANAGPPATGVQGGVPADANNPFPLEGGRRKRKKSKKTRRKKKKKKHKGGFKYSRIANSRRSLRMTRRKSLRHKKHHKKHKRTKKHRRRKRR